MNFPMLWRHRVTLIYLQVTESVASNYEVFILNDTWMDSFAIRDFFEDKILYSDSISARDRYIIFVVIDVFNGLSILWNILVLMVLFQDQFRKRAINMYLSCLCTVFLLDSGVKIIFDTIEEVNVSVLETTPYLCPAREVFKTINQTLISTLVTAVSIERYFAVVHPFSRMADISPKTVFMVGTLTASFMGPTWGPPGAGRNQVGPMLAPWALLSG